MARRKPISREHAADVAELGARVATLEADLSAARRERDAWDLERRSVIAIAAQLCTVVTMLVSRKER